MLIKSNKYLFLVVALIIFFAKDNFTQDCFGKILIKTNNYNSTIFLNNKFIAKQRIDTLLVKEKYYLKIIENNKQWNSNYFYDTISISNCNDTINLTFDFENKIYVKTVKNNSQSINDTILLNEKNLFVSNTDYKLSELNFNLKNVNKKINDIVQNNLKLNNENDKENFFSSTTFKILASGIFLLGGTTAYFKLQADDYFDKYRQTGEKKYLDKTDQYDLISGISFVLFQIDFGFIIYKVLTQ